MSKDRTQDWSQPGNVMNMEGRKRKEKGGAEKARNKKKRMLEEGASKYFKITDVFKCSQI